MSNDYENQNERSRSGKLVKRRKTNLILNSLIAIVLLLIIFVSAKIFFSDGQEEAGNENAIAANETAALKEKDADSGTKNVEINKDDNTTAVDADTKSEEADADDAESDSEVEDNEESKAVITEGGSSPDVKKTIENPDWKPIGTTQTGEHVAVYDESSVDWQEMLKAIAYATGVDDTNMTVWRIENNGGPNSVVGTISEKSGAAKYRVAIEWVDSQGWKPVKVEELNS